MHHESDRGTTPEAVLPQLASWWQDAAWVPEVVEIAGPPRSGRTETLRRLSQEIPDAASLDATGLTVEELQDAICEICEVDLVGAADADWSPSDRAEERRLVLLSNTQRAGRTRHSSHPRRCADFHLDHLARSGGLGIIVEVSDGSHENDEIRGSDGRDGHREKRRRFTLVPHAGTPEAIASESVVREIRALALAEGRHVPIPVWQALAQAHGAEHATAERLTQLAQEHPALLRLDSGQVRFCHEYDADRLRDSTPVALRRAVNHRICAWLRAHTAGLYHADGWQASGDIGGYAATALPMHALHAGESDLLINDGRLAANVAQDALLDALSCMPDPVPGNSGASDAFYAHLNGIAPPSQREWAAWLHLMAVARGDANRAREIESSGVRLPWKVRWTHWRPPGGWQARFTEPGSIVSLTAVRKDKRDLVVSFGEFTRAIRIWDLETGEQEFPAFAEELPQEVAESLSWPGSRTTPITAQQLRKAAVPSGLQGLDEDLLSCSLTLGGLRLLAGSGGIIALESTGSTHSTDATHSTGPTRSTDPTRPTDPTHSNDPTRPAHPVELAPLRNEALVWPYRPVNDPVLAEAEPLTRQALDELFGSDFTQRVPAGSLPSGLTDETAQRILTEIGLPPVDVVGLGLDPIAETGLREVAWPAAAPESGRTGPFFRIGKWWGGTVVIDGGSGEVLRTPSEDEPPAWSDDFVVASHLEKFLTMVHFFTTGVHMLAATRNRMEGVYLRVHLETGLESLDARGAESPAWMYQLRS
ncbi:SUKH-4 family immunity protein [Streptomyces halobius]|uniref:SUKH-4 family immunity protein n=1 Tax=Streptomyces halobius TaxID=2879846 RepID=A0ABY4MC87_9ACTN|nr:SUKH-4 family immunity protein [Streptomyces halobius]UQA95318.1 SUKH-4 family immunity protein [Streptomyces halobius]